MFLISCHFPFLYISLKSLKKVKVIFSLFLSSEINMLNSIFLNLKYILSVELSTFAKKAEAWIQNKLPERKSWRYISYSLDKKERIALLKWMELPLSSYNQIIVVSFIFRETSGSIRIVLLCPRYVADPCWPLCQNDASGQTYQNSENAAVSAMIAYHNFKSSLRS